MTFDEYDKFVEKTDLKVTGNDISYPTLALCGEAGEVAEKIKKIMRDKGGVMDEESKKEIQKELGDVLWYLANASQRYGSSLKDVAKMNVEKITSRHERGVVNGNGDNR